MKKRTKFIPKINTDFESLEKYNIKNYNNKYEVSKMVSKKLQNKYLSNINRLKPIINIETGLKIEIWKNGIKETFENDKYYRNLPLELKKAKICVMDYLAKLIKYANVRAPEANNYHNCNSKVRYMYLKSFININKKEYEVNIDIRKSPNGENKFYIHSFKIKNKDNSSLLQSNSLMGELSLEKANKNGRNQLSVIPESFSISSITSQKEEVNTVNYYIQEDEKNSNNNSIIKEESKVYYVLNIA